VTGRRVRLKQLLARAVNPIAAREFASLRPLFHSSNYQSPCAGVSDCPQSLHLRADSRITLTRIWAVHDVENEASGKVMLKLGMEYEGTIRRFSIHPNISVEPRDAKMYSSVK